MIKEEQTFKPTLKKPMSVQSKNFEKNFNNGMKKNAPDVKLNETESTLSEAEQSLKKKIFSLSKMEALVHADPKLSAVYDEMSVNGEEKYGYHYNETIMNMIFNDYVLNSPKYLQKYKMAIPIKKKRRDQSGINQLKKAGEEKMEKTNPEFKPKKLEPSGLPQQEKKPEVETEQIASESTGAGSAGASVPALGYQKKSFNEGEEEIDQPQDDDCFIESNGFKYSVSCGGKFQGEFVEMEDALNKVKEWKTKNNWFPNTWFVSDHGNFSLIDDEGNILKEGSTAGSAGGAARYVGYAGSAAWGKGELLPQGESSPTLRKPIWHGGTVIQENKTNYLVDPSGFEKYFNALNEADLSYQRELGKEYQQSHTKSNNGLGVSEVPQSPEITRLKKGIDDNTALFIGQDVDKMRPTDVKILHNDMTQKHSMFPHPDNLNLQDDGISGINQQTKEDNVIIDKTSAFTSDTVKNWNKNDTNVEMDTLKTGEPDKPNLSVVEQLGSSGKISTKEELHAYIEQLKTQGKRGISREDVPRLAGQVLYDIAVKMADRMLPMGWDGLADVNSMWDYIKKDGGMTYDQLNAAVKRAVNVRLKEEGYSLKDLGLGESEIDEVSKSKRQQRFMGMVHAIQKGELSPKEVGGDVAKAAKTMQPKDVEDFASTKHKELPEKVDEIYADALIDNDIVDIKPQSGEKPFTLNGKKYQYEMAKYADGHYDNVVYSFSDDVYYDYRKWRELVGMNENVEESTFNPALKGFSPMGFIMNYLKQKYPKTISLENEKDIIDANQDVVGTQLRNASPRQLISFAEDIYKNKNIKEDTQTMIQNNGTSISNKATATGDQSGNVEMGARSTGGGMSEAKDVMDSENKLLEELNKELEAYSIHNDKLKKMTEDKRPSALVLKDRLGNENEKNFKSDLQDSSTKEIIDVEKELQYKDQQTEVGKDPQKLGKDLEKKEIKVTDAEGDEALKNEGDSANDEGDEIPKRNMTTKEQHEVDMMRKGQHSLVYDNEPGKRFEDRMKKDMGDKVYKMRQEQLEVMGKQPTYNKDPQPVKDTSVKKVQYNKEKSKWNDQEGLAESAISGKYFDDLNKRKVIDFNLSEVVELTAQNPELHEISLEGMGNTYTNKVDVNESAVKAMDKYKFFTDSKKVFALKNPVQTLNESKKTEEKPVINEEFNKMKHLLGYEPKNFVDTKNTKRNRGF